MQDGRSSGLTAPNGPSQSALIRAALKSSRAAPTEVGLVSIHGTGTPLGDPIEVGALGQGFGAAGARADGPTALLSNKSCYGHTEGTAGTIILHPHVICFLDLECEIACAWRRQYFC